MVPFQATTRPIPGSRRLRRRSHLAAVVASALLALCMTAAAQEPPAAPLPDPLQAQADVAPLVHRSALSRYRRLADVPLGSWREANDTVTRIGGWRVYAREAAQPDAPTGASGALPLPLPPRPAPAPAPAAPGQATPTGHDGHPMK